MTYEEISTKYPIGKLLARTIDYKWETGYYASQQDKKYFTDNFELVALIEYQGQQHYDINNGYYSEDLVRHDQMKKEYCEANNIPLIIIDYKRNYNIKYEDLRLEEINGI